MAEGGKVYLDSSCRLEWDGQVGGHENTVLSVYLITVVNCRAARTD